MIATIRAYATAFIAALVAALGAVIYWRGRKDQDNADALQDYNDDVTPEGMAIVRDRMVDVLKDRKWKKIK